MPGCARSRSDGPMSRKLVLVVIDGLTPTMLETSLGTPATPTLTALAERRHARPRHDDLPLAHPGLPLVDRHRGAPGRARDPAPRLVAPWGATARRVRLVVRRGPCGGSGTHAPGHAGRDEQRPSRPRRGDPLRGVSPTRAFARLPSTSPPTGAGRAIGRRSRSSSPCSARSGSSSTTSSRASAPARRSRSETALPAPSTPTPPPSGAGSSTATDSTFSSSTSRTTTTRPTRPGRTPRRPCSSAATTRSAVSSGLRAAWTSFSPAMP